MRKVGRRISTGFFIILLFQILCGISIAGELDGTVWSIFIPTIKDGHEDFDNTMPYSFTDIIHESSSSSIQGVFEIFGTPKSQHDFHGAIKKIPDGYTFGA